MSLSLDFRYFPNDFDPKSNFFRDVFNLALMPNEVKQRIEFYGCYVNQNFNSKLTRFMSSKLNSKFMQEWLKSQYGFLKPSNAGAFNIWVTYENLRVPNHPYDLTFSFDLDDYGGSNIYLPIIYLYTDLLNSKKNYVKNMITQQELKSNRIVDSEKIFKSGDICAFISNPQPLRMRAIEKLSNIFATDVYGRVSNRSEEHTSELQSH